MIEDENENAPQVAPQQNATEVVEDVKLVEKKEDPKVEAVVNENPYPAANAIATPQAEPQAPVEENKSQGDQQQMADMVLQNQLQHAIENSLIEATDLIKKSQFISSQVPLPEPLKIYLTALMQDGYNRFCIDCKTGQTSHCLVAYGTFVCRECAVTHKSIFGQSAIQMKAVLSSHWDDYQLSSVAVGFGGNKPLFELFKEYDLQNNTNIMARYSSRAAKWYRKRHLDFMDGVINTETKPIKNSKEALARGSVIMEGVGNDINKNANKVYDKVKEAKIGDKIKGFWGKVTGKKKAEEPTAEVEDLQAPETSILDNSAQSKSE